MGEATTVGGPAPRPTGSPSAAPRPESHAGTPDAGSPRPRSGSGAFADARARRRYLLLLGGLVLAAVALATSTLVLGNPMPPGSRGFRLIVELRVTSLVVILVVAVAQALATVSFQTVTANRIITPSIMGFESLYVVIQTGAVYLLGVAGVLVVRGTGQFLGQVAVMVALSVLLYGWLLRGRSGNLHLMLLVGIIIGGGLASVSAFMQRLLTPSEFDVLTARLFGSVSNARVQDVPWALGLCAAAAAGLWLSSRRLDVLALGADAATNAGLDHRRQQILVLVMVSVLMATSTALVGPMTFFGFLVATLSYQLAPTPSHRHLFPVAALAGFVVLAGAYVLMDHVFAAQGVVSIIVELVGGTVFLVVLLRKGRL